VKDLTGLLEADAVLALIGEVLRLVPFKTDSAHYNSIITNSQLHDEKPLWHNSAGWELDETRSDRGKRVVQSSSIVVGILVMLLLSDEFPPA
jgi:hypothetical protein